MTHPNATTAFQTRHLSRVVIGASVSTGVARTLILPFMDVDRVTGRLYAVLGSVQYNAEYTVTTNEDSTLTVAPNGYDMFTSGTIYAHSSDNTSDGIFTVGVDIGATCADGIVMLPDSLLTLPQVGAIEVGVKQYDPTLTDGSCVSDVPSYYISYDLGSTWDASSAMVPGGVNIWDAPLTRALLVGHSRAVRTAPLGAGEPSATAEVQKGASGWIWTQGRLFAELRMPVWVDRSSPGIYGSRTSPYSPNESNPGGVSLLGSISEDGGTTVTTIAAPTLAIADVTLTDVPGFPFAGDWVHTNESTDVTGDPWVASTHPPLSGGGCLIWAHGWGQENVVYLFCASIMRQPIPRTSYTPGTGGTFDGAFREYTDSETSSTGKEWGHTTPIVFAYSTDGGYSYSGITCVQVDGSPVLVASETVRIAASMGAGHVIYLMICSDGLATVLSSFDAGATWGIISQSSDNGATFAPGGSL